VGTQLRQADATPTKQFFVQMLTRDISLTDCILDLIDNSIDGAWDNAQIPAEEIVRNPIDFDDRSLSGYRIDIDFTDSSFTIRDNCGGITLDDAADYAFTFGRKEGRVDDDFSVGVYGIGMKRAVFKLGSLIDITSTYTESNERQAYKIPINVAAWLKSSSLPWDFDIEESESLEEDGVRIEVTDLADGTQRSFADPTFEGRLVRTLARDYMIPLMHGLEIRVNSRPVVGWEFNLQENENFAPVRLAYNDEGVRVDLIAGMWGTPPDDPSPDEKPRKDDPSGWYIVCNGRVVLGPDTSITTGWGDQLPKWHRQYSGFAGIVVFSSTDPSRLPMTTTKRNVDASSRLYSRAVEKMHEPARAWIDYSNKRKQNLEEAQEAEKGTASVNVFRAAARQEIRVPVISKPASRVRVANVNYAVELVRMQRLQEAIGNINMSYRDAGIAAFEYAYDDLVGD